MVKKPEVKSAVAGMQARWPMCGAVCGLVSLVVATLQGCAGPTDASWARHEYSQIVMGVLARVTVYSKDEAAAREGVKAAFAEMNRCDAMLSDYRRDSQLSRVNESANAPHLLELFSETGVSPDFEAVLLKAQHFAALSDGAFDITCGSVVNLWRSARRSGQLPTAAEIEAARRATGWHRMSFLQTLSSDRDILRLDRGMRLDAGGIGKGVAADRAREVLAAKGFDRCLIVLAGDMAVGEPPPGESGWRIGIWTGDEVSSESSTSVPTIEVSRCGVSTSGDAEQFVEIGGVRYSHIVDPRTGWALTDPISATVVASDATTSDALGTAVCVMGEGDGVRMIEDYAGASVRVVVRSSTNSPGGARVITTRGFPAVR